MEIPKPPGRARVLFLGDSCTQQGYPRLVELYLTIADEDRSFEAVTLAVAGYSPYQGRVLAETYGVQMQPDFVVVYFGWNDH